MRIAYFDTIAGISGDMILGSFVNAGLPLAELNDEIQKLRLPGVRLEEQTVQRSMISAAKIDVIENDSHAENSPNSSSPQNHHHHHDHEHGRGHSHPHQDHSGHSHADAHDQETGHRQHEERDLASIRGLIDSTPLGGRVKETANKIFDVIAAAEARVHGTTVDKIHFHEVGAVDSIVDIVGAAICFEKFDIEAVYSSPVRLGSGGTVRTRHGVMPVPVPATVEILKDYPTVLTDVPFELTTPTGAAVIRALSKGVLTFEEIKVDRVGYGAGTREFPQLPNLLRLIIGELEPRFNRDEILIVETNIDDMNPEFYPFIIEQLIEQGAHDAYLIPIIMKKGRPGILMSIMVEASRLDAITKTIYSQTSTIGLRIQKTGRVKLPRVSREIMTMYGLTKVKEIQFGGDKRIVPEFEECKRIALERKLPLMEVYKTIEREGNR